MKLRYCYFIYIFLLYIIVSLFIYLNWNELEYPIDYSKNIISQTTPLKHKLSVDAITKQDINVTQKENEVPFYTLPIKNSAFDFFRKKDDPSSILSFYFFITIALNKVLDECSSLESSDEQITLPPFCYVGVSLSGYFYSMNNHIPLYSQTTSDKTHKNISVCINLEHTLIYHPQDSLSDSPYLTGRVFHNKSGSYYRLKEPMCRILDNNNDIIFEYALPNVQNYVLSGHFTESTLKKLVYMPSIGIFDINNIQPPPTMSQRLKQNNKTLNIMTSFWIKDSTTRRSNFLDFMESRGIQVTNINSMTSPQKMAEIYDHYHIILNIRQTDIAHTIEEMRILPAIERGLIVISETAPLIEILPYYHNVLWCDTWEAFPDIISTVTKNYASMHSKLVGETSNLKRIILDMSKKALSDLKQSLVHAYTK